MTTMIKNLYERLDLKPNLFLIPAFLMFIMIWPLTVYLPEKFARENSWVENIQMVVLFATLILCFKVKDNKKLFYFAAMVVFMFILREVNYGRMIFFKVPGEENSFYSWKEIKYGYLVNPMVGLYVVFFLGYFLYNQLYKIVWEYVKRARIPVWHILFMIFGSVFTYVGDENRWIVFEESCELLFYVCLLSLVYMYGYRKEYQI